MTIYRVIKRSRCLQSSCKSLILPICSITKSCITMKVFSLWATRIRWLLSIYLSTFLLWLYRRVLWRLQRLTKATIWTLQLLVQNWSKTPLSARSNVWRRIHVCPSTWQIWMTTLTICCVNCFHLTITPIQTSSSPTIFGITTVLR